MDKISVIGNAMPMITSIFAYSADKAVDSASLEKEQATMIDRHRMITVIAQLTLRLADSSDGMQRLRDFWRPCGHSDRRVLVGTYS